MNRDIFDEEFDKLAGQQGSQQGAFDSWSNHNYSQPPVKTAKNKPWKIVLIAVLMVVCIAVGWILAVVTSPDTGNDDRKDILNQVIDHMDVNFYEEISDEEWQLAVEQAGSILMQYAGDQFSFLMSPQTYYDYTNDVGNTLTAASNANELFGMTYSMETKGMLISDIAVDSASYGHLQKGDMVVKMTNIKEYIPIVDKNGNLLADQYGNLLVDRYSDGSPKLQNSPYTNGILLEGATSTQLSNYLLIVYSANFHVLRNGEVFQVHLQRNKVGLNYDKVNLNPNKRYDFKFVEYYLSEEVNNISTKPVNGAAASTYQLRGLDKLPAKTAYVRIKQFDMLSSQSATAQDSCDQELKTVLQMFEANGYQRLVLDLKGNPGGYVHLTVNIAGMLIHPNNLSASERAKVEQSNTLTSSSKYLVTRLVDRDGRYQDYTTQSSYYNYFPQTELANGKKRIIVWTDGGSASASELLTGTLLDYKTAVHMGQNTYGKGIAQTIDELNITGSYIDVNGNLQTDGKWAVYYTFANYYAPLGKNIQGVGYAPANNYTASNYNDLWTLAKNYWGV